MLNFNLLLVLLVASMVHPGVTPKIIVSIDVKSGDVQVSSDVHVDDGN